MKRVTLKIDKDHCEKVEEYLKFLRQWKKDSLSGKYKMIFGPKNKE